MSADGNLDLLAHEMARRLGIPKRMAEWELRQTIVCKVNSARLLGEICERVGAGELAAVIVEMASSPEIGELVVELAERARREEDDPDAMQRHRDDQEQANRWDEELAAFRGLQPELARRHPDRFVAIEDGAVIAVGDTRLEAVERACQQTGEIRSHFVRHVDDTDYSVREEHVWLGKPRSVEPEQ